MALGEDYGRMAYDAYKHSVGGVSAVSGDRLPEFDNQSPVIQEAWRYAADTVADAVHGGEDI